MQKALVIESNSTVSNRVLKAISTDKSISVPDKLTLTDVDKTLTEINDSAANVLILGIDKFSSIEMKLFEALRSTVPDLPIIVLTEHNKTGGEIAVDALKKGAVEYIPKTSSFTNKALSEDYFGGRLLAIIKAVPRLNKVLLLKGSFIDDIILNKKAIDLQKYQNGDPYIKLIVVAGCLGGVPSLYQLLSVLPGNLLVPVVVVQHMPDIYTTVLAEDLNRFTELDVVEATDQIELKAGKVYVCPGNYHSVIKRINDKRIISLNQSPKVSGFRPSIDVFMKSAIKQFGNYMLTVYLAGGGKDGIEGAKSIDLVGGQILIQNSETSLLADLPESLGLHGMIEGKYPIDRLGDEIVKRIY